MHGVRELLELGPGQGRDSLFFAAAGITLTAIDFAEDGLDQISHKADMAGLSEAITTTHHDVRARSPTRPRQPDLGQVAVMTPAETSRP